MTALSHPLYDRTVIDLGEGDVLLVEHRQAFDENRVAALGLKLKELFKDAGVRVARFGPVDNVEDWDLRRIAVNPGDKLVLHSHRRLTEEAISRLYEMLGYAFPENETLVIEDGFRLRAYGPSAAVSSVPEASA